MAQHQYLTQIKLNADVDDLEAFLSKFGQVVRARTATLDFAAIRDADGRVAMSVWLLIMAEGARHAVDVARDDVREASWQAFQDVATSHLIAQRWTDPSRLPPWISYTEFESQQVLPGRSGEGFLPARATAGFSGWPQKRMVVVVPSEPGLPEPTGPGELAR